MKDINLAIRIERKQWKSFLKQSRGKGLTASERLRALVRESLEADKREAGEKAFLQMGAVQEEGCGPADLSSHKDGYLYGQPGARPSPRKRAGRR